MSFPAFWVLWLAVASGQAAGPVTVYTNADLLRFGPAPGPRAEATPGTAGDREVWLNVQRFLDRQYRRIDTEREQALDRQRAATPPAPATVYVYPPYYGRHRPYFPVVRPPRRPRPDPGPPKAGSDHSRFPDASDRPLRQVVPVREQVSRGRK